MNDYRFQSLANVLFFVTDEEYKKKYQVLKKIYRAFEQAGVKWALACSSNLYFKGITDEFNDFDVIIAKGSVSKAKAAMIHLGAKLEESPDIGYCRSNVFLEFNLEGIDIDMISGFRVLTFATQYLYEYAEKEVEYLEVDEIGRLPLIATEAQFILYAMMEGWQQNRRHKRKLIQAFLAQEGLKYKSIFQRDLQQNLPAWIKKEMMKLM